jgi:hypothetical protein
MIESILRNMVISFDSSDKKFQPPTLMATTVPLVGRELMAGISKVKTGDRQSHPCAGSLNTSLGGFLLRRRWPGW